VDREKWPAAPLDHQVDDGKAVALLLADLAFKDHRQGLQEVATVKKKARKRREKEIKKLEGALPWAESQQTSKMK
jgi:hypothetical protein